MGVFDGFGGICGPDHDGNMVFGNISGSEVDSSATWTVSAPVRNRGNLSRSRVPGRTHGPLRGSIVSWPAPYFIVLWLLCVTRGSFSFAYIAARGVRDSSVFLSIVKSCPFSLCLQLRLISFSLALLFRASPLTAPLGTARRSSMGGFRRPSHVRRRLLLV